MHEREAYTRAQAAREALILLVTPEYKRLHGACATRRLRRSRLQSCKRSRDAIPGTQRLRIST